MDRQCHLVILILVLLESVHGRRAKRIILGRVLLDRELYSASSYYVWISDLHMCGYVFRESIHKTKNIRRKKHVCPAVPRFLRCGGVLLTPKIVQTACHCLSVFAARGSSLYSTAKEKNAWETMFLVYPGFNDVQSMKELMFSSRYYVHKKCSQLNWEAVTGHRGKISIRYILHNYGLITLKASVEGNAELSDRVSYAPIYTQYDIELLWRSTESKEYTCLFFGFGPYSRTASASKVSVGGSADCMRYGWRTITNYYDCYDFTYPKEVRGRFPFDYRENATWSCGFSQNDETNTFLTQGGDSGGPVVCNGEYYGVIGEPSDITASPAVALVSPIAFTVFENTNTFRGKFIKFIQKVDQDDYPPEPIRPTLRYFSKTSGTKLLVNTSNYKLAVFILMLWTSQ